MSLIISKDGKGARKLDRASFEKELKLQKYIEDNPESIPIEDMNKGTKLLILAREFPVQTGSIDALGIDEEGNIYIIETKLYKNTDKRYVLAQVLEYAAFFVKTYESGDEFVQKLEQHVLNRYQVSLRQKIAKFLEVSQDESEVEGIVAVLRDNFDHSIFNFFVVMDEIPSRLKEVVLFINENSRFDILLVELEYYEHNGYQILIPKLFGTILKKDTSGGKGRGQIWNEESFFARVETEVSDSDVKNIMKELYEFTRKNSSLDPWLKRPTTLYAMFNFYVKTEGKDRCVFQVMHDGGMYLYRLNEKKIRKLNTIGFAIPEGSKEKEVQLEMFKSQVSLDDFKKLIMEPISEKK